MYGQIHCIRDDCGRRIGGSSRFGKHRDSIGDSERKAAASPSARRNSADRVRCMESYCAEQTWMIRPLNHAHRELFPLPDVDGNVAAVVHISAAEICARSQFGQNIFSYCSSNRSHLHNKTLILKRITSITLALLPYYGQQRNQLV